MAIRERLVETRAARPNMTRRAPGPQSGACARLETDPALDPLVDASFPVIPAKAGIQFVRTPNL